MKERPLLFAIGVIANYALDALEVTTIRPGENGAGPEELVVKTYLSTQFEEEIKRRTGLSVEDICAIAESGSEAEKARLLPALMLLLPRRTAPMLRKPPME